MKKTTVKKSDKKPSRKVGLKINASPEQVLKLLLKKEK